VTSVVKIPGAHDSSRLAGRKFSPDSLFAAGNEKTRAQTGAEEPVWGRGSFGFRVSGFELRRGTLQRAGRGMVGARSFVLLFSVSWLR